MKKEMRGFVFMLVLVLVISLTFVSAGWFGDAWNKITGEVADTNIDTTSNTDVERTIDYALPNEDGTFENSTNNTLIGIKKIAFWYGKVNQHYDKISGWKTDPDGAAGGGTYAQWGVNGWFDRKIEYCQRFWPDTILVTEAGIETFSGWRNAGNQGNFTTTKMTYECVQENSINTTNNNTGRCADTDGGINYVVQGVTSGRTSSNPEIENNFKDICLSNMSVGEYFCENNFVKKKEYDCSLRGGYCIEGACRGMARQTNQVNQTNETKTNLDWNLETDSSFEQNEDKGRVGKDSSSQERIQKQTFFQKVGGFFSKIFSRNSNQKVNAINCEKGKDMGDGKCQTGYIVGEVCEVVSCRSKMIVG